MDNVELVDHMNETKIRKKNTNTPQWSTSVFPLCFWFDDTTLAVVTNFHKVQCSSKTARYFDKRISKYPAVF